jgi:hypothetical protein
MDDDGDKALSLEEARQAFSQRPLIIEPDNERSEGIFGYLPKTIPWLPEDTVLIIEGGKLDDLTINRLGERIAGDPGRDWSKPFALPSGMNARIEYIKPPGPTHTPSDVIGGLERGDIAFRLIQPGIMDLIVVPTTHDIEVTAAWPAMKVTVKGAVATNDGAVRGRKIINPAHAGCAITNIGQLKVPDLGATGDAYYVGDRFPAHHGAPATVEFTMMVPHGQFVAPVNPSYSVTPYNQHQGQNCQHCSSFHCSLLPNFVPIRAGNC